MSLIAAFYWSRSPRCSISMMIFDSDNVKLLLPPKIQYLPKGYFKFKSAAKTIIQDFFQQVVSLHKLAKNPIIIEFKIVFQAHDIPYLMPAKESKLVYKLFTQSFQKNKKKFKLLELKPQLRRRLSGKPLKRFKKELRSLHLVSRKRDTGFEYHLWSIALHATQSTYAIKLQQIRNKLVNAMWDEGK